MTRAGNDRPFNAMGRFVVSALVGATGAMLFVACGGTGGSDIESSSPDAQGATGPTGVIAARRDGDAAPEGAADVQLAADVQIDRGTGAETSLDASPVDATGDRFVPVADASDGAVPLPSTFTMPAKLFENGCWQDQFPNPVCKTVPKTSPPIVDWGTCTPPAGTGFGEMHMATLRIPPKTCLRVSGRWDPTKIGVNACVESNCSVQDVVCKIRKNSSETEDDYVRVHYKRDACAGGFTAWWYPIEECPDVEGCK